MRLTSHLAAVAVCLAAVAGWTSPASATSVIDQSNVAALPVSTWQTIANNLPIQSGPLDLAGLQFVTAGVSGQLTQVDVQLAQALAGDGTAPVGSGVLFIAQGSIDSSGHASGNVLAQLAFNTNSITGFNTWKSFDVSGLNLNFNAGDQFIIALEGTDDANLANYRWATTSASSYAGGDGYLGFDLTGNGNYTWVASGTNVAARDYGFRTWMQGVPEPGTWLLMLLGFGFIGLAMRRRSPSGESNALLA